MIPDISHALNDYLPLLIDRLNSLKSSHSTLLSSADTIKNIQENQRAMKAILTQQENTFATIEKSLNDNLAIIDQNIEKLKLNQNAK